MRLSGLELRDGLKIIKDGEFDYFGLLYDNAPGRIISFFENKGFKDLLLNPKISCVICKENLVDYIPDHIEGIIVSDNPKFDFWKMNIKYGENHNHNANIIKDSSKISPLAYIAKENVEIGKNVLIEEFVTIKENTVIGDNVIIRSGSVVGGEVIWRIENKGIPCLVPQFGKTVIEDDVVINYNNTIVRGAFNWQTTRVGKGVMIDSNNFLSHNLDIGEYGYITSSVTISGDNQIGKNVWMSPGVTTTNSIKIGNDVKIMLGSLVRDNIPDNKVVVDGKVYDKRFYDAIRLMKHK